MVSFLRCGGKPPKNHCACVRRLEVMVRASTWQAGLFSGVVCSSLPSLECCRQACTFYHGFLFIYWSEVPLLSSCVRVLVVCPSIGIGYTTWGGGGGVVSICRILCVILRDFLAALVTSVAAYNETVRREFSSVPKMANKFRTNSITAPYKIR